MNIELAVPLIFFNEACLCWKPMPVCRGVTGWRSVIPLLLFPWSKDLAEREGSCLGRGRVELFQAALSYKSVSSPVYWESWTHPVSQACLYMSSMGREVVCPLTCHSFSWSEFSEVICTRNGHLGYSFSSRMLGDSDWVVLTQILQLQNFWLGLEGRHFQLFLGLKPLCKSEDDEGKCL